MHEDRQLAPGRRSHVTRIGNRVVAVTSAAGGAIGHAITGDPGGPTLLVAGAGAAAAEVFERLLGLPGFGVVRGRLVLLCLDRLDDSGVATELDRLAGSMAPIKETMFLSAVALDDPDRAAQTDALLRTVVRFCGSNGLQLQGDRRDARRLRD